MTKYLLDTHIIIWFIEGNERLSDNAKKIMLNYNKSCVVSILSLWEISIKLNIGKLKTEHKLQEIIELCKKNWTVNNIISNKCILAYRNLPLHHRDPFDRMLIAQTKTNNYTMITKDSQFKKYDIRVLN